MTGRQVLLGTVLRPPRRQRGWDVGDESEAHFQARVLHLASLLGWRRRFHTFDALGSPAGLPDLILVHPEQKRVVWAELKSAHGRVTTDQRGWLDDLRVCGQEVYLWKPADWSDIMRILGATV